MSNKQYSSRQTCRVCGSNNLKELFSFGEQFVSDFVEQDKVSEGNLVPIDIEQCQDCSLVQAKHAPPSEILYKGTYWYRSGITDTMKAALRGITASIEDRVQLLPGDMVMDIGSNDGTLLRSYEKSPVLFTVGVEPAKNLVEEGRVGIKMLINDLWSAGTYQSALGEHTKCKVITAIGMFYDLEDPNQFIRDIALALQDDGLFVCQLMCLKQTLEQNDVGNFAHEHLEFYTLKSLRRLLNKHGLEVEEVTENSVNGGSYRVFVRHQKYFDKRILNQIEKNAKWCSHLIEVFSADHAACDKLLSSFYQEACRNRHAVVKFIQDAVVAGKKVWVYGASTKGNVLLQWYGLKRTTSCPRCGGSGSRNDVDMTSDVPMTCHLCLGGKKVSLIQGAADRDPNKQCKYTIGTGIPIFGEGFVRDMKPDYFVVLPYAFRQEFVKREAEFLERGGHFIFLLPKFEVL